MSDPINKPTIVSKRAWQRPEVRQIGMADAEFFGLGQLVPLAAS